MCKVSVIVAAYNIEKYIDRCLKSVMNQTFDDMEIIVVNDGSTDNTLNIINENANIDKRIKIINKKNMGLIEARKSGFYSSKGIYTFFIDGDDWIEKYCISKLYNIAIQNDFDIVRYKYFIENYEEKIKRNIFNYNEINSNNYVESLFTNKIPPNIFLQFIKREFIIDNGIKFPKDICFAEDVAFSASLAMYNPKIKFIEDELYCYCQRGSSLSNKVSQKMLDVAEALDFIEVELKRNNLMDIYREEFEYLAYLHNYNFRTSLIYKNKQIYKKLYVSWKKRNINIYRNNYYKQLIYNKSLKEKIAFFIMEKSYYSFYMYSKLKGWNKYGTG